LYWPQGFGGYIGKDIVITDATIKDTGSVHDPSENDASCPFIPICVCAYEQLAGSERRSGWVKHSPHLAQGMKHKYEGKLG